MGKILTAVARTRVRVTTKVDLRLSENNTNKQVIEKTEVDLPEVSTIFWVFLWGVHMELFPYHIRGKRNLDVARVNIPSIIDIAI